MTSVSFILKFSLRSKMFVNLRVLFIYHVILIKLSFFVYFCWSKYTLIVLLIFVFPMWWSSIFMISLWLLLRYLCHHLLILIKYSSQSYLFLIRYLFYSYLIMRNFCFAKIFVHPIKFIKSKNVFLKKFSIYWISKLLIISLLHQLSLLKIYFWQIW